jgi:hypothetical protein
VAVKDILHFIEEMAKLSNEQDFEKDQFASNIKGLFKCLEQLRDKDQKINVFFGSSKRGLKGDTTPKHTNRSSANGAVSKEKTSRTTFWMSFGLYEPNEKKRMIHS